MSQETLIQEDTLEEFEIQRKEPGPFWQGIHGCKTEAEGRERLAFFLQGSDSREFRLVRHHRRVRVFLVDGPHTPKPVGQPE